MRGDSGGAGVIGLEVVVADDPILPYFSPRHAAGRGHLATLAVTFALAAIPGFCLILPGPILGVVAIVLGGVAVRFIKEDEEPLAHRRAQVAVVLGFLEVIVGAALFMAWVPRL